MAEIFRDIDPSARARMFDDAAARLAGHGREDLATAAVHAAGRIDHRITFELLALDVPVDPAQKIAATIRIDAYDGVPSDGAPLELPHDAEIARLREELTDAVMRLAVDITEEGFARLVAEAERG